MLADYSSVSLRYYGPEEGREVIRRDPPDDSGGA
jgi:hypothetical protein